MKNLNKNNKKEDNEKMPEIDGWGLILLIIGIAIFLLRPDIKSLGGIVAIIGFIRIIYIFKKNG